MSNGFIKAIVYLAVGSVIGLAIVLCTRVEAQNSVPCWNVPNGVAWTTQCANGFWQTIMPTGEVLTGNGMIDPNATAAGSTIVLDKPGVVTPPTQILPMLAPFQGPTYGYPVPE